MARCALLGCDPRISPCFGAPEAARCQVLAWKEIDYGQMSEREKQMLVSEVNLLRELRHPNIVR